MSPDAGYLHKRKEEQSNVLKTDFWKDFIKAITHLRVNAVDRCVKNEDIDRIKFHQGEVYSIDRILEIPKKLWDEIVKK